MNDGRDPSNFYDSMETLLGKDKEESARSYELKILRILHPVYDINMYRVHELYSEDSNLDVPLLDLKDEVQSDEFSNIFMRKLKKQTLKNLVMNLEKSVALKAYVKLCKEEQAAMCGMVFPVTGGGDWIMHNFGYENTKHATAHIFSPSKNVDMHPLIIVPIKVYVEERMMDR